MRAGPREVGGFTYGDCGLKLIWLGSGFGFGFDSGFEIEVGVELGWVLRLSFMVVSSVLSKESESESRLVSESILSSCTRITEGDLSEKGSSS